VKYNVYLPDGFGQTEKTYPVVYLLHGLSDDYTAWVRNGSMQLVADELIGTGEACEMVIVMPNAGGADTRHIWNGYFNMPGWRYEDSFSGSFCPPSRKSTGSSEIRATGPSWACPMGGGGSAVYCQRHPDMFPAATR
jgi:Enterochelin esterase and related enzymes